MACRGSPSSRIVRFIVIMSLDRRRAGRRRSCSLRRPGKLASAHRSDHERIDLEPAGRAVLIYDRNGSLAGHAARQRTEPVAGAAGPGARDGDRVDHRRGGPDFYRHNGVNLPVDRPGARRQHRRRARSAGRVDDHPAGREERPRRQRAQTSAARSARRSSRVELEKQMTKDQILERYLNTVYFGNGAYGVQAAAEIYFNKDVSHARTGPQAALLAALIRSPSQYDPLQHPERGLRAARPRAPTPRRRRASSRPTRSRSLRRRAAARPTAAPCRGPVERLLRRGGQAAAARRPGRARRHAARRATTRVPRRPADLHHLRSRGPAARRCRPATTVAGCPAATATARSRCRRIRRPGQPARHPRRWCRSSRPPAPCG